MVDEHSGDRKGVYWVRGASGPGEGRMVEQASDTF